MPSDLPAASPPARVAFYNDPKVRSIAYQVALCAAVAFLVLALSSNAIDNLARAHIASGFGFWNNTAGFDISQTLIEYSTRAAPPMAAPSGSGCSIRCLSPGSASCLRPSSALSIGIARLSTNWLVARTAAGYVEIIRNIPLLLQLLFWYNAVLKALPDDPREPRHCRAAFISTIAACFCRSRFSRAASASC